MKSFAAMEQQLPAGTWKYVRNWCGPNWWEDGQCAVYDLATQKWLDPADENIVPAGLLAAFQAEDTGSEGCITDQLNFGQEDYAIWSEDGHWACGAITENGAIFMQFTKDLWEVLAARQAQQG